MREHKSTQAVFDESCDDGHHTKICCSRPVTTTHVAHLISLASPLFALGLSRLDNRIKGALGGVVLLGRRLNLLVFFIPVNVVQVQLPRLGFVPAGTVRATMVAVGP